MRCVHRAAHGIIPSPPRLLLGFSQNAFYFKGRRYASATAIPGVTFGRASAATDVVDGTMIGYPAGQPRINKNGFRGEGPGSNLARWSQDFSNPAWVKTNGGTTVDVIYPAAGLAPDGTATVNKIVERTDVGAGHDVGQTITAPPGNYAYAVRFKAAERTKGHIRTTNFVDGGYSAVFDLVAGTATLDASQKGSCTNGAAFIVPWADGWFDCILLQTTTVGTGFAVAFGPTILPTLGNGSYAGEAGKGIYAWGAQPEPGTRSSSYIITGASSGSRSADSLFITGVSDILTPPFTMVAWADIQADDGVGRYLAAASAAGSGANRIIMDRTNLNGGRVLAIAANAQQTPVQEVGGKTGARLLKIAGRFDAGTERVAIDGALTAQQIAITNPVGLDRIDLAQVQGGGGSYLNGYLQQFYVPGLPTDTQLQGAVQ